MTAFTVALTQVNAINAFVEEGKSPWLTITDNQVVGVYRNRDLARAVKNGKPVKYEAGMAFGEVINDLGELPSGEVIADAMGHTDGAEFKAEAEADAIPADLAPAVKPVPPLAPEAPKAADKPKADVRHVSEPLRPTKLVWAIADEMKEENPSVTRKDVLAECERRGIAFFTARTQYQVWKSMQA